MWCEVCQQDVPGAAGVGETGPLCCARCRGRLGEAPVPPSEAREWTCEAPPIDLGDDWQLDDDLRAADRLVDRYRLAAFAPDEEASTAGSRSVPVRVDPAPRETPAQPAAVAPAKSGRWAALGWGVLSVGVMAFACGAVLLGCAYGMQRPELWSIGLPTALAGQAALVVGLALQLEGVWQSNRRATKTLASLDDQMDRLRHATSLLCSTHSTPAQSFYVHLAEGASPHILLGDLKGQLDLLATQMARTARK